MNNDMRIVRLFYFTTVVK